LPNALPTFFRESAGGKDSAGCNEGAASLMRRSAAA
jgi:hypothetical protein